MEYIYAAMLIHRAGKKVDEATVTKVLEAAGVKPDAARVKALVASLEGVNIDEAIQKAAVAAPAAPAAAGQQAEPAKEEQKKKEEKSEENKAKADESAAAGLGALFG